MITPCLVDISLTDIRLTKCAIDFGGGRYITTVKTWCSDCLACQRRKSPHRRAKLPTSHLPVDRPFQRISIDLVGYETESVSPTGPKCLYALTIIDHLTRLAVLVALPDKKEETIAKALVERVLGIFGPPETLHSDQGPEFENKVVKQLQDVFGDKKTKTTPYRPQGDSGLERMHSTLHAMLSMYNNIAQNNWAEVLPFIQQAHNTSFSSTMHETPFFLMFGRQARLPVDIIFGIPHVGRSATTEEFAHFTRENLQIAFELARRNLSDRVDKQKANNSKLPPINRNSPPDKRCWYANLIKAPMDRTQSLSSHGEDRHNMFQIVTGCVSNPTPERHETSVCTFGPHQILRTPVNRLRHRTFVN